MDSLQWHELPPTAVGTSTISSPWFGVSMALIGFIVGVMVLPAFSSNIFAQSPATGPLQAAVINPANPPEAPKAGGCGCGGSGGGGCGMAGAKP